MDALKIINTNPFCYYDVISKIILFKTMDGEMTEGYDLILTLHKADPKKKVFEGLKKLKKYYNQLKHAGKIEPVYMNNNIATRYRYRLAAHISLGLKQIPTVLAKSKYSEPINCDINWLTTVFPDNYQIILDHEKAVLSSLC